MTGLIQQFLAARAAPKQPIVNEAQVTRAEFTTLAKAVEILINDLDAVTAPGKLEAALNAAVREAAPMLINARRASGDFKVPTGAGRRAPLALPGDDKPVTIPGGGVRINGHLVPAGD
jgi:hypothetical protein